MKKLYSILRKTPTKRPPGSGVKLTVPRAAMSIAEMLRRYVRREALPMERHAVYIDAGHDLEKLSKMDRVDQQDVLNEVRDNVARMKKEYEAATAPPAAPAPKKKVVPKQKDPKKKPDLPPAE